MEKTGFEDKKIRRLPLNKLAVPVAGDIEIINIQDIIRCEADGSYTHLFVQKRKLMISKTLKLIERRMKGFNFLRVHQHHLVNLNHVVKYTK
ncbi:MAG: hypothetical protein KatS3mg031_2347 [Chitinophagales bacterium]|nr:MAG: hypothetical protein KatS3mg031_2347 [Chitinophagales bacterium]